MCLKQKDWSKRGIQLTQPGALITSPDNSWPPPLPFHAAPKIPQPNILTLLNMFLCAWMWVCVCVCVFVWVNESVCECVCLSMWVSVLRRTGYVGKVWICLAEEFLEPCGKEEAAIRNCLVRWSEHLVVVADTPFFDQYFCFKHISFFVLR